MWWCKCISESITYLHGDKINQEYSHASSYMAWQNCSAIQQLANLPSPYIIKAFKFSREHTSQCQYLQWPISVDWQGSNPVYSRVGRVGVRKEGHPAIKHPLKIHAFMYGNLSNPCKHGKRTLNEDDDDMVFEGFCFGKSASLSCTYPTNIAVIKHLCNQYAGMQIYKIR